MHSLPANPSSRPLSHAWQLREAVLLSFCDPLPAEYARLLHLSRKEWENLLHWLDTSGLALYFLNRVEELGLLETLPLPVIARLQQNLADNSKRLEGMIAALAEIQRRFQAAGLAFAVLKGFSLWPISVPKLELRSQLDLDLLVAEENSLEARRILEDAGYRLTAIGGASGRHWEFKANEGPPSSLKDHYRASPSRSAELHIETVGAGRTSQLSRIQKLDFRGVTMPVLSPIDLFVGQGLHVYHHVCSGFLRTAHLLEFYRHVIARRSDDVFWCRLQEQVGSDQVTCVRLGMVMLLISRVMGRFAPEALTFWTVDQLPATARLWVDMYARRMALASFPGSKLYLLLQEEMMPMGLASKLSRKQALLPRRLPRAITQPVDGETFPARMKRYRIQFHFFLFSLSFHIYEGILYLRESILWRQNMNRVSR